MNARVAPISGTPRPGATLAMKKKTPNNFQAVRVQARKRPPQRTTQSFVNEISHVRLRSEVSDMTKNQVKQESTEDSEPWLSEDSVSDFGEASNDSEAPIKAKMMMRHKIEDLLESRRLKQALEDYESFDVDEGKRKPDRLH
jgi:hypothetical protein